MSKNHERNIHFIFLFLLGSRLIFIFSNATTSTPGILPTTTEIMQEKETTHASATSPESTNTQIEIEQEPQQEIVGKVQDKISLTQDIQILESEYKKNKDVQIAKTLIQTLAQNYEFEKANSYLQELIINPEYDESIEPTLHLYIAIHDPTLVSITDPQSIQKIIPIMNEYKNEGRLSTDDYNFYQGLIKLRYKDFK